MVAAWNWVDWLIVAVVGLSAVVSLMRGLVVEVFSLLIAVCAALMSFYFALPLADAMLTGIELPPLRLAVAAVLIYVATSLLGAIVLYLIRMLVKHTGLSGTDRLLGVVFGLARGGVVIIALVWLGQLAGLNKSPWWLASSLMPTAEASAESLSLFLPQSVREMISAPDLVPADPEPEPKAEPVEAEAATVQPTV
ncbi:MAG: CvpA family protein [Xanthomonadales bacterium]|nr:CvpA family protein [Xanthomonadales bacterium]